jgi:hypothetical protein
MLAARQHEFGYQGSKLSFGLVFFGALLIALLAPARAMAQGVDLPAMLTAEENQDTWISASYAHQFETDLNDGGSFDRESVMIGGGHRFALSEDWSLVTNLAYQGSYYDFSGKAAPYVWNDIHQITGVALLDWKMDESWSFQGGALVRTAAEGGANFGSAFTGGGLLGFNYRASKTLSLGALVGITSEIENPVAFVPIPQVDWRFADDWKFHLGLTNFGYTGVGPEVSYAPNETWEFGLGASYQTRRYRLDHHQGFTNGVGQETSAPLYARVRWRPQPRVAFDLFSGFAVGGQMRLEAQSGNKLQTSGYDTAPIFGLRGQIVF